MHAFDSFIYKVKEAKYDGQKECKNALNTIKIANIILEW